MNFVHTFDNTGASEYDGSRRMFFPEYASQSRKRLSRKGLPPNITFNDLADAASRAAKSVAALSGVIKLLKKSRLPRKLKKKLKI